jgi:hypothetical protein
MIGKGTNISVDEEGMLNIKTRKAIAEKVFDRLDGNE